MSKREDSGSTSELGTATLQPSKIGSIEMTGVTRALRTSTITITITTAEISKLQAIIASTLATINKSKRRLGMRPPQTVASSLRSPDESSN